MDKTGGKYTPDEFPKRYNVIKNIAKDLDQGKISPHLYLVQDAMRCYALY
jgi:hypothetical protein